MVPSMREISVLLLLSTFVMVFISCNQSSQRGQGRVHVEGSNGRYQLIRNEEPFLIKGAAGFSHLRMLDRSGANTIRTWDTTGLREILDSAQAHHLAVMVGLPLYNSNHITNYYNDSVEVNKLCTRLLGVVDRYKNHPALLMWCLGNELNYFYRPDDDFFKTFNRMVDGIHAHDPDHPVTTALLNFTRKGIYNLRTEVPDLDIVSINTYGRLSKLKSDLEGFSWFWDGPFIVAEWGINGYWESDSTVWGAPIENTSSKKAEQYKDIFLERMPYENPRYLGSFVFYWGALHEKTPTWYGLFDSAGSVSESVSALSSVWGGQTFLHHAPEVEYMLIEGRGARENIILTANTIHHAEIVMKDADSLEWHWEIRPEDWYKEKSDDFGKNRKAPAPIDSLIIRNNGKTVTFAAPSREGPYRIYIWIHDAHGNFATANTPFYVIEE
jgi:hypothetical protein